MRSNPARRSRSTVKIERNGYNGQVPFGKEGSGRNLPFGVIVDNLGLNGLLVLENQRERVFFITADASTPEQVRPFHLTTTAEGGQSSRPVILRVKKRRLEDRRGDGDGRTVNENSLQGAPQCGCEQRGALASGRWPASSWS